MEATERRPRFRRPRTKQGQPAAPKGPEQTGAIKVTFDRGFGFIKVDGGEDVFVRKSNVPEGCWEIGTRLVFRTIPPVKGNARCAVDVRAA